MPELMPPYWLLRVAVAGVWLYEGLWCKLLRGEPREFEVVKAVVGHGELFAGGGDALLERHEGPLPERASGRVVGVAGDVKHNRLSDTPIPMMLLSYLQVDTDDHGPILHVRSRRDAAALVAVLVLV